MTATDTGATSVLATVSDELAAAVEHAGASVVRVEGRQRQSASGVAWSADGLIVTANHVLERDEDIRVGLPDGQTASAKVVGRDQSTDVAVLRVEGASLTPISRGPSPKVGHFTLIVARPGEGLETSIGSVGALEGTLRSRRGGGRVDGVIRTDATFYPGFSGGPLINASGEMIGLATSGFGGGIGIPLATVEQVASAIQSHGTLKRGYLGVVSQPVALSAAMKASLSGQESGLLIVGVEENAPAAQAGFTIGDILVALNGQPITDAEDLFTQLGTDTVGTAVTARVLRGGQPQELTVTVGERK